ncbi:hypothetical protein APHAL10511_007978 [Amanita phalloides]|nr:hypothetical protein APHAL10511_007978 [Amanita phalloides]
MRFSARSPSQSPERGQFRGRSSYGLYPESESEPESDEHETTEGTLSGSDSDSVESSDVCLRLSDLKVARQEQKSPRRLRTDAEMRYIEDAIAAIRLRTHHRDPYEEWEQQTRKDAFRTAKKVLTESQRRHHDKLEKARTADLERLSVLHTQQTAEVHKYLTALRFQQQKEEQRLRDAWKNRDQKLRERIESGIKLEEEKVRRRLEEERIKEQRRLDEERKRLEEEKRQKEAEDARRQKDEEERVKAVEKQRALEEERIRVELQNAENEQRGRLGLSTTYQDWSLCRHTLHDLKDNIKKVKEAKQLKKEWGELRRKITPKIGQLTNDNQSVSRISNQLLEIFIPPRGPPLGRLLRIASLSSLAKAILLQAETEVTAEARTAEPLARVTANLILRIENFGEILFTRMMQRIGGWAIPIVVPAADFDGRPWKDDQEKRKVMGYRKGSTGEDIETTAEYCTRISGIMRVYFHVLKLHDSQGPLWAMFQTPRYWAWFARMFGGQHRLLLDKAAAAYLIHTALDVMGTRANDIWGIQWIKMLAVIYEGVTEGLPNGPNGEKLLIGGPSPEGKSARMRVLLAVERIMKAMTSTPSRPTPFS